MSEQTDPHPSVDPEPCRRRSPATLAVELGRPTGDSEPINPSIVLSSIYQSNGAEPPAYGRQHNPTWSALEEVLGGLEGGHAVSFSAGVAAIRAVLAEVPVGGVVVAPADAYSGTRANLEDHTRRGLITTRLVDIADTDAVVAACDGAALLWVESPTNPLMRVADLPALVEAAHDQGVTVAVDNTFSTPLGSRPLEVGADVVVHSVTKFLSGHSDVILGACVATDAEVASRLVEHRTLAGTIPGPVEAWLAVRGLRSFPARFLRAQTTAQILAERLDAHPGITTVHYPGLPGDPFHERARKLLDGYGAMISVEITGGARAADALCQAVRVAANATSLGGVETTLERRSRQPGEAYLPDGLIRISVGCEDVEDLWEDLTRALDRATTPRHKG